MDGQVAGVFCGAGGCKQTLCKNRRILNTVIPKRDAISARNVGRSVHIDTAVCPRRLYRILSPRKLSRDPVGIFSSRFQDGRVLCRT